MTTIFLTPVAFDELQRELIKSEIKIGQHLDKIELPRISIRRASTQSVSAHQIVNLVCQHFADYGVGAKDVFGKQRPWRIIRCRHTAIALMRNVCHLTLCEIATAFNVDHSAIGWACTSIANLRGTCPAYSAAYDALEAQIKSWKL
jgi:chromosomal replication initiation ATPase DnaA